ncbi:MAG: hypothetical protein F4W68_00490 [Cenarchaeum sp. SB0661_bin_35]|nr:hypothetical protein [Cenarchaeum sp. SB0666_bin_15]MYC78978.1 hypothetical protein [Cenarchaeum sp. SB0661_bin_35]MYI51569.1 hypothetical protein [Cenarchaeum sp. SB0673_bin_9]
MEDDIEASARMLLGLGLGDKHILEQIYRASVNKEIISNHERQYVASLMEKHAVTVPEESPPVVQSPVVKQADKPPQPKKSHIPLIIAVGGIAVVVIIASVVLMMPTTPSVIVDLPMDYVEINQDTYQSGDFMVITGMSDYEMGKSARVDILDSNNNSVWSESVALRSDGSYSTIILVGQDGWIAGEHTIQVTHGDIEYMMNFVFDN